MATIKIIKEAIGALKERTGSSVIAINKWIEAEKKVGYCKQHKKRSCSKGFFSEAVVGATVVLILMESLFFHLKPSQSPHTHTVGWICPIREVLVSLLLFYGPVSLRRAGLRRLLYNFVLRNCDVDF